jgi:hypothetical protein
MKPLYRILVLLIAVGLVFTGCFRSPQGPELPTAEQAKMLATGPHASPAGPAVVSTEIVLCLDVSGSISQAELQLEIDGLKAGLNDLSIVPQDGSVAVAIVVYGATANNLVPALTPLTATSLTNTLEPALDGLMINRTVQTWATNTGQGVINSRNILAGGVSSNKYIVLVGDGASNTGPNPINECAVAGQQGIKVCAIAVGATQSGIQELQACANAANGTFGVANTFQDFLPVFQQCLIIIVSGQLELEPNFDQNPTGTVHTLTATARCATCPSTPIVGVTVNFHVIAGPNMGVMGSDVTDSNGEATFSYLGAGGIGVDSIQADMIDPNTSEQVFSNVVVKEWFNSPPECDANGPYSAECAGPTTDIQLDGTGSSDPDGDPLTYGWTSDCPGASFDDATSATPILTVDTSCACEIWCTVTLTVTDPFGAATQCMADVHIEDTTPPTIVAKGECVELWPPNHKYRKITIGDCLESASDVCDGSVDLSDVKVAYVSSDELENAIGVGDGNTEDDIVIECPNTVYVRSERQGTSNGRVYTIHYEVADASGNVGTVACTVGVPHDQSGPPAVDGPGPGYSEAGCISSAAAYKILLRRTYSFKPNGK